MLTPKQEKFVQGIIEGMSQADAYRNAYSCKKMSDKTIYEAASRLMADSNISARVQELRERVACETIMSARKRQEWLTEFIKGAHLSADKLRALDILNKMTGEYVQKIEAEVSSDVTINIELSDDE
jgi:phage terminase small subunit